MNKERMKQIIQQVKEKNRGEENLLEILHAIQEEEGGLPKQLLLDLSEVMNIPLAKIWNVVTFYNFFKLHKSGKYVVKVCKGTACHVKGADKVIEELEKILGIKVGETTKDGMFTLEIVRCVGACGLAPVVMVNDDLHGNLDTPEKIKAMIDQYKKEAGEEK